MVKYISKLINGEELYYLKDTEARANLIDKTEKGAASGVATLDQNGKIPDSQLPDGVGGLILTDWNLSNSTAVDYIKNKPVSMPASDVSAWAKKSTKPSYTKSEVGLSNVTNDAQVKRSEMGAASGVATLDSAGKIPSSQLPSYVDDVLEYNNKSLFPAKGETGKIYVDKNTNLSWRWGGTDYVQISPSLALGETSSTAYAGNKGKALADKLSGIENGAQAHKAPTAAEVKSALGTGSGTSKYLREDGTWQTPPDTNTWPTKTSQLTNDSGFLTGITKAQVTGALGYTPPTTDTNTTYSAGSGLSLRGTTFSLSLTKALVTSALGYTPPTSDTNTWRPVLCNGTDIGSNTLNISAGSNVSLSRSGGTITISSTDTNTWPSYTSQLTNNSGFITSSGSCSYATSAGNADTVDSQHFTYSNSSDSPTYLWSTNSSGSSFLAARSNLSVRYASSAGSSDRATRVDILCDGSSNNRNEFNPLDMDLPYDYMAFNYQRHGGTGATSKCQTIRFYNGQGGYANCEAAVFSNVSDIRDKQVVDELSLDIVDIANSPSFKFLWKNGVADDKTHAGTSAQYWKDVLPEVVYTSHDSKGTLSLSYDVLALLASISIAKETVSLKSQVESLTEQVKNLEDKLKNLENNTQSQSAQD